MQCWPVAQGGQVPPPQSTSVSLPFLMPSLQVADAVQTPLLQTWPEAQELPCATQVPPTQQPPLEQVLIAQQGWPGPPQATQVEPLQTVPALQVPPLQQGWPALPQPVQMPEAQVSPVGQSLALAQPQAPATQIWPDMLVVQLLQTCPLEPQADAAVPATQVFVLSQQPLVQVLPAQQGWPAPPQATVQVPEVHVSPLLQAVPLQQGWPEAPQGAVVQVPEVQTKPLLQAVPLQQGWPEAPQATKMQLQVGGLNVWPMGQEVETQEPLQRVVPEGQVQEQVLRLIVPPGQFGTQLPLQSVVLGGQPH